MQTTVTRAVTLPRKEIDDAFLARHGLQEYIFGAPGGIEGDAAQIDREVAESSCPRCGTRRQYWPFIHRVYGGCRPRGGSYRAFRVCLECGLEEEF